MATLNCIESITLSSGESTGEVGFVVDSVGGGVVVGRLVVTMEGRRVWETDPMTVPVGGMASMPGITISIPLGLSHA
jgi:hypothetical protein